MNSLSINPLFLLGGMAVSVAIGAGSGWTANGWRLGEKVAEMERDQVEAVAAANETARLRERAWSKQSEEARNAATKRETNLRRDAAGARQSADGMRHELTDLRRRLPELAVDACRIRADTLADILGQCTGKYQYLAETTDRLGSDRQSLMDAWPK